MVAYGAVASLLMTLQDAAILLPVHLKPHVESLRDKVSFLEHSLENCFRKVSNQEIYEESLEAKIRDVAFKAEDLIASKIANLSVVHKTYPGRFFMYRLMHFVAASVVLLALSQYLSYFSVQRFVVIGLQSVIFAIAVFNWSYFWGKDVIISDIILISTRLSWKIKQGYVKILSPFKVQDVQCESLPEDEDLREILREIEYIVDAVKKIEADHRVEGQRQRDRNVQSVASSSFGSKFSIGHGKKVVSRFEKDVEEMKSRLYGNSLKLEIVPIVGMGGIGKTTLARRVYDDGYHSHHFNVQAWTTVSQEYSLHQVLISLLDSAKLLTEKMHDMTEEQLFLNLYQSLKFRRYLIVIDDMWDAKIWDAMQRYFPDDNNGSRLLLTTRLQRVAQYANPCSSLHRMSVLNKDDSWNLLCNVVFGEKDCPMDLESIGKEIAGNCEGLPLVLGVTGGFLSKESRTIEAWTFLAQNLSSIVTQDDKQCMAILSLSYNQLPQHLRPCLLCMAMFPQDQKIPVDDLLYLWAAEGFLKLGNSKSLEVLAEEYLEDLVERNLILVHDRRFSRKIITCGIHNMLWNFCMQRAQKESFFHVVKCPGDAVLKEGLCAPRRFILHFSHDSNQVQILSDILSRDSSSHSLYCSGGRTVHLLHIYLGHHMLLKVLDLFIVELIDFPDIITRFVNLRYLAITYNGALPPWISRLRKLETLIHRHLYSCHQRDHCLPVEIWLMQKLRHICVMPFGLIKPLVAQIHMEGFSLLENLQTLHRVRNLRCGIFFLGRMQNLKELRITYDDGASRVWPHYQLEALANLHQLEILHLGMNNKRGPRTRPQLPAGLAFPRMLNSLVLNGCEIPWDRTTIMGSLLRLHELALGENACQGTEWNPNVNEYGQLKILLLDGIHDLIQWNADDTHFPRLQSLCIKSCHRLNEIPSGIGDIPTLEDIILIDCHPDAVASAKQILEQQKELGNDGLKVVIINSNDRKRKLTLRSQ